MGVVKGKGGGKGGKGGGGSKGGAKSSGKGGGKGKRGSTSKSKASNGNEDFSEYDKVSSRPVPVVSKAKNDDGSKGPRKTTGSVSPATNLKAKPQWKTNPSTGAPKSKGPSVLGKRKSSDEPDKKWQPLTILQDADGPANKKRALRRQRSAQRPHFEAVSQSKALWNELREKKCPAARREELVAELHGALVGKYQEVALKHDASRLVQAVIQFGSEAQRLAVLEELSADQGFVEVCRSTYAHYVIVKLLESMRSKELMKKVAAALQGHMVALATHGVAARVVELALTHLKVGPASALRLELYGREFTLFADELKRDLLGYHQAQAQAAAAAASTNGSTLGGGDLVALPPATARPSLAALLAVRPARREAALDHVGGVVGKLVLKGLLPFLFVHELLCEYLEACDAKQFDELLPSVVENALVLLSTRPGTRAVCLAVVRGEAKERRRLLKLVKGHAFALLGHRDAYLAVLALCEVTDDTVAVQKSLLAELCVVPTAEDLAKLETFSANPFLDEAMPDQGDEEEDDEGEGEGEEGEGDEEEDDDEGDGEEGEAEASDDEEEGDGCALKPAKKGTAQPASEADVVARSVPLLGVALSHGGSKLLLRVLAGSSSRCLDPAEAAVVLAPSPASRKDPSLRRDELLAFLAEPLAAMVAAHAPCLLASRSGALVVAELFKAAPAAMEGPAADAVARACCGDGAEGALFDHPVAHACVKKVLLADGGAGGGGSGGGSVLGAALVALSMAGGSDMGALAVASGRGAHLAWALLQAVGPHPALLEALVDRRTALRAAGTKGADQLAALLDELAPEPAAKTKSKSSRATVASGVVATATAGAALKTPNAKAEKPGVKATVSSALRPATEMKAAKKASPALTRSARKAKAV